MTNITYFILSHDEGYHDRDTDNDKFNERLILNLNTSNTTLMNAVILTGITYVTHAPACNTLQKIFETRINCQHLKNTILRIQYKFLNSIYF